MYALKKKIDTMLHELSERVYYCAVENGVDEWELEEYKVKKDGKQAGKKPYDDDDDDAYKALLAAFEKTKEYKGMLDALTYAQKEEISYEQAKNIHEKAKKVYKEADKLYNSGKITDYKKKTKVEEIKQYAKEIATKAYRLRKDARNRDPADRAEAGYMAEMQRMMDAEEDGAKKQQIRKMFRQREKDWKEERKLEKELSRSPGQSARTQIIRRKQEKLRQRQKEFRKKLKQHREAQKLKHPGKEDAETKGLTKRFTKEYKERMKKYDQMMKKILKQYAKLKYKMMKEHDEMIKKYKMYLKNKK